MILNLNPIAIVCLLRVGGPPVPQPLVGPGDLHRVRESPDEPIAGVSLRTVRPGIPSKLAKEQVSLFM